MYHLKKKTTLLMNCLSISAFKILWSWRVCVWISLILSYLEFTELLGYLNYYFSSNLRSLGLLFLQTSFFSFFSTLFLGLPSCVCCRCLRLYLFSFTLFPFCSSVFNVVYHVDWFENLSYPYFPRINSTWLLCVIHLISC